MAIKHAVRYTIAIGGVEYSFTDDQSAGEEHNLSEAIADMETDAAVPGFSADVSTMKSIIMASDVAMTVKTNSDSVPDDTFVLVANQPIFWSLGLIGATNPITVDIITGLFITTADGAGTLTIKLLQDPTP